MARSGWLDGYKIISTSLSTREQRAQYNAVRRLEQVLREQYHRLDWQPHEMQLVSPARLSFRGTPAMQPYVRLPQQGEILCVGRMPEHWRRGFPVVRFWHQTDSATVAAGYQIDGQFRAWKLAKDYDDTTYDESFTITGTTGGATGLAVEEKQLTGEVTNGAVLLGVQLVRNAADAFADDVGVVLVSVEWEPRR